MKVMCIKDIIYAGAYGLADKIYFSKDKVYTVNKEYDYGVSVYVDYNDPPSSFMFYYDSGTLDTSSSSSKYMGLMYEDYFVSIEDYRNNQLKELGI